MLERVHPDRIMPAKVILYIASTLDGYIATEDGGIDWLTSYEGDHGYEELMARTGALAMGSGTYAFFDDQEDWAYPDQPTWVFTSRELRTFEGADIRFTDRTPAEVIDEIRESAGGKDVWLVGGGLLATRFLRDGLVDEIQHFVVPKALAKGIPMFTEPVLDAFDIEEAKVWPSGIVELRYKPKLSGGEDEAE